MYTPTASLWTRLSTPEKHEAYFRDTMAIADGLERIASLLRALLGAITAITDLAPSI